MSMSDEVIEELRIEIEHLQEENERLRSALRKLRAYVDQVIANGIDGVLGEIAE